MKATRLPKAFTLIELLVAAAVTAILVVMLLGVTQNFLNSHERSVSDASMSRDASFVLDMLTSDLATLAYPRNGKGEVLRVTAESVNGLTTHWLTFQAYPGDRDAGGHEGSPRTISYRLAWQDAVSSGGNSPMFALYRKVSGADETLTDAMDAENLQSDFWASRPTTELGDYLAGHVAGFRLRLLDPAANLQSEPNAPGQFTRITAQGVEGDGVPPDSNPPRVAEISISLLSSKTSNMVQSGAITAQEAVERFGRTFTRQVVLPAGPEP